MDIARQWLATGHMYAPFQLAGPYVDTIYQNGTVVNSYPPPVTLFFAAFLYLPGLLWWILPLWVMSAMAVYWRPAPWSWPLIAGSLAILPFAISIMNGNTILWMMAAMALATRWPGAALGLAGKPILLPFAIPVLRPHRSWLIFGAVGLVLALLVLPHWPDYFVASRNGVAGLGIWGTLFYYFPHQFLVLVPLIPWLARTRQRPSASTIREPGSLPVALGLSG
jgi:hypothetical protein